jgi:uracil phosphoribosyltransferase
MDETREYVSVISHALAQEVLTDLRRAETTDTEFRTGLARLGQICGYELLDSRFDTRSEEVQTPLAAATGTKITGRDTVVLVNVLRAATPFVEGLLQAFPAARQGVISASRNESAGMEDGAFPVAVEYVKLPDIESTDTVVVADPMLATGSTMVEVLGKVTEGVDPGQIVVLSAVSAAHGLESVHEQFPGADLVTVAIDDHLDDDGFIVPGLGDAGDRAFGTD